MKRAPGFTLLEVVLAVSIMSLIVATLYMAFGQATRTWSTQNILTESAKRMAIVTDMLSREFDQIRPYSFVTDKGTDFFFSASPAAMFYVTPQGFGARRRSPGRLYFSCLYLAPDGFLDEEPEEDLPEEGLSLYLCKLDRPEPWFLEELREFKLLDRERQEAYTPGLEIREASVFLLSGIVEARFSCSGSTELPKTQNATEPGDDLLAQSLDEPGFALTDMDLDQTIWETQKLPALVQFAVQSREDEMHLIQGHPFVPEEAHAN